MNSSQALVGHDRVFNPANGNQPDPWQRLAQLDAELAAQEPVVGAALLAVTAFRLRDEAGLIETLRHLSQAAAAFEQLQARDDD